MDDKDLEQFEWEKRNLNVSGLDPKSFKFFKYDDPYKKRRNREVSGVRRRRVAGQVRQRRV